MNAQSVQDADIDAGNAFRDTLVPRADRGDSFSPAWSGWALMEAFLAGAAHARLAALPAREPTIEECAAIVEKWASRIGCHASEIATDVRALSRKQDGGGG